MPTLQALASLTNRLWKTGNLWARWAIGLTSAWPPVLALVALFGSQALMLLFGLVPVAALVFVLIAWTDPLVIPVLAATHFGRTGLQWASTVLASELLLGVYFALVPVHNDPALIPLLLLIAAALGFLSTGVGFQSKGTLQGFLLLLIVVITAIFLAGGTSVAEQQLREWTQR